MRDKGETEEGYVNLSHLKAQRLRSWDEIERAYNEKKPIKGVVVERIKGGLTVDIQGARAFLPGSQVDLRPMRNLDGMKGQTMEVAIIKLNKKRGNIVVSRKQLLEEEQNEKRGKTLEHLEEGSVLTGIVKNLTEYGAFVDMGGIDGLLHITDMSWGRLTHPRDLVNVGDQIQVKVLKYDKDKQRVSLGFKQLTPDPWLDAEHRYPVGAHVHGRVISVTDYGAFVELEQGIEGLVHVSEMTWSKRMKHPSKLVNVGDEVDCVVLKRQPDRAPDFARHAAARVQPLGYAARQISRGSDGRRPSAQSDRVWRFHRNRRRNRWPGARQQPELDDAREASFRSIEEGRQGQGRDSGH
jgi:small subunit ribosomal protein S1